MTERKTLGEIFRALDAAMEHASFVEGFITHRNEKTIRDFNPGTVEYHTLAVMEYLQEAWLGLQKHVPRDWQICPYEHCHWGIGVDSEGYYFCPHCNGIVKMRITDSEIDDVRLEKASQVPPGILVTLAHDFGPTWATPKSL